MLALRSVTLHRFKAAFDPSPAQLEPFSLLIGRNGSGKSTILEALQWVDTTLRADAGAACERYRGMMDLINLRSQTKIPYFSIDLEWHDEPRDWAGNGLAETDSTGGHFYYSLRVDATSDNTPRIVGEWLSFEPDGAAPRVDYIATDDVGRHIVPAGLTMQAEDRLALGLLSSVQLGDEARVERLRTWWADAVFLRLSPSRLAEGAPARRPSSEPLLDEEGQNLATLLMDLNLDERLRLVELLQHNLPGMQDVEVSTKGSERDQRANYSLLERMPYRGRAGRSQFPIPAWMLSEGTRRLTAILALLVHDPPPSLLCIEEVENGLDPWTVQSVLAHLRDAAGAATQVVVTTHSPWLLDHVPLDSVILVRRHDGNTEYERFIEVPEIASFDPSLPAGTRYVNLDA